MPDKSVGQTAGAVGGAIIGGTLGALTANPGLAFQGALWGASLGASIGGMVGGLIDPPNANLPDVQGPMETQVNTFHRNLPVPIVYGVTKVGGNLIWMGGIRSEVRETGGGKGKPKQRKIYYHADWAVCLSEGTIQAIGRVWLNDQEPQYVLGGGNKLLGWKQTIDEVAISLDSGQAVAMTLGEDAIAITCKGYAGKSDQGVDPTIAAKTSGHAPHFRHTAYLLCSGQLGQAPQLPIVATEVVGITATISSDGGFPVRFSNWRPTDQWQKVWPKSPQNGGVQGLWYTTAEPKWLWFLNKTNQTEPGAADDPAWATGAGVNFRAKNVSVDLTKDFTLTCFMSLKEPGIFASGQAGIAITGKDGTPICLIMLVDRSNAGSHVFISREVQAIVGGTTEYRLMETNSATNNDVFTQATWWKVEKRGTTLSVYGLSRTKVLDGGPETDWHLDRQVTLPDLTSYNPGRLVYYVVNLQDTTNSDNNLPSFHLDAIDFVYFPVGAVAISSRGNPALAVYDFLTNTRYGCGISPSIVDQGSHATAALFCDEDVTQAFSAGLPPEDPAAPTVQPDPNAPGELRFRLDLALTEKKAALDHLNDMLATFRGFLVYGGGKIKLRIEKEEDLTDVQHFSDTPTVPKQGIIEGTFSFQEISQRDRPNRIKVEYVRFDDQYRRDFVVANDEWDQDLRGEIIERTITLTGIKRQSQANRMAQYFLDQAIHVRWICKFRVGIGALTSEVGDVIKVTHSLPGWVEKPFRILRISEQQDDELELDLIEYVPGIYHDKPVPADIEGTKMIAEDMVTDPPNAIRLRVFEPRDHADRILSVTWSLDPAYEFFLDTFVYRKRGSGLFESQGVTAINATTAFLSHFKVGFAGAPTIDNTLPGNVLKIICPSGMSGILFSAAGSILAQAVESGGAITIDMTSFTPPVTGYVQLYVDNAYTHQAYRGRFPETGTHDFQYDSVLTYQETEITYSPNPSELRLAGLLGAIPASGDLQVEHNECSFTGFVQDPDGDRVTGVTWPNEPDPVTLDNRVTDLKVYVREASGLVDRTASFQDPASTADLFTQQNYDLYIGSPTKKLTQILVLLQRLASVTIQPTFSVSTDAIGTYAVAETVSDGTKGFTQSGIIGVEPPFDWTTSAKAADGSTIGDGVARYYLRILRTAATVTTTPRERRVWAASELLATLQEDNNRHEYTYTAEDLGTTLTFQALVENVLGNTADATRQPEATITLVGYAMVPSRPSNVELDRQGALQIFMGGNLLLNWLGTSKVKGAGRVEAGNDADGAGGGRMDPDFQHYVLDFFRADGVTRTRRVRVNDVNGTGTSTLPEATRNTDSLSRTFTIKVYQEAGNRLSEPVIVNVTPGTWDDFPDFDQIPSVGDTLWDEYDSVDAIVATG